MHGKTDQIHHNSSGIFAGLPNPMVATRYHSLVIRPETLSEEFEMTAWADGPDGETEIMGIEHKDNPTFGLQFHPESFLTTRGSDLLNNFLNI
jgi:anthranilate synthase component 2